MTMLSVDRLTVEHDGRTVVDTVTFRTERGECIALMGASGTGKTTVLRAIAGLQQFRSGTISIDGHAELHRKVGMVFQFHHLFPHLTAAENVWLSPVHVLREPRASAESRARALLDKLGVGSRADALPHRLSGGEAQRVAIARALAVNPPVLLMDEPTASLDPARRTDLAATLRQLAADGTTLIVATHDADFARAAADRVLVMADGRIMREGAPADLLA
jgi:ABC-type polar amino acid transport system ATPase subunit